MLLMDVYEGSMEDSPSGREVEGDVPHSFVPQPCDGDERTRDNELRAYR